MGLVTLLTLSPRRRTDGAALRGEVGPVAQRHLLRLITPVIALALLLVLTGMQPAPFDPPLVGTLLGGDSAAQDRIILYDVTTGTRRDLFLGTGAHRLWGFSPDGCRLLYTLQDGTAYPRAYTARLDGSEARELVQYTDFAPADWGVWEPQWSPDGGRIAFTLIRRTADSASAILDEHRIAWVPADGGTPAFYSVSGDEHMPRWSPDGAWLAYLSVTTTDASAREAALWVVSLDGATKYRLTNFTAGSVVSPRWSPDSSLLAFVYSPRPFEDQYFMIANAPDAIPTQLSYAPVVALDLQWMPDGAALAASALGMQGAAQNLLWRLPLIGSADQDAIPILPPDRLPYAAAFRFSADGSLLAVRADYRLLIVEMSSGAIRDPGLPLANTGPIWSPAGFAGEASCTG